MADYGRCGQSVGAACRISADLPAGLHRSVVRRVLAAAPSGLIACARVAELQLQLEMAGPASELVAYLGQVRDESRAAASKIGDEAWLPATVSLDRWSSMVLLAEHADALLNALAGSISFPSSVSVVAGQGAGVLAGE